MTPDPFQGNRKPTPPAGVLRGPADADNFRVQVGRYGDRWYTDNLPPDDVFPEDAGTFPSVSTVKKASGSDWSYVAMQRVNAHLADIVQLRAFKDADLAARYDILKSANSRGLDAAARRGTNVHLIAEGLLYGTGDDVGPDDPGAHYRPAVEQFFNDHQPELVAAEFVCIHRDLNGYGYGGTADALVDIGGKLYIVDWKSRGEDSKHGAYPEEGAQAAAYARAQYMLVEGDHGVERRPLPDLAGGLIVSIKPDGYRVYPIDLDAAWDHWCALHAWWVARRTERDAIGRQWPVKKTKTDTEASGCKPIEQDDPGSPAVANALSATPFDSGPSVTDGEQEATVAPAPRTPADELAVICERPAPDEGDAVDDGTYAALEARYKALPTMARTWVNDIARQATQAGVSIHMKGMPTVRRFEIMRALCLIAVDGHEPDGADEVTRTFLQAVIGDVAQFPSIPVGHLVGSLSATEAATFASLVDGTLKYALDDNGKPMAVAA